MRIVRARQVPIVACRVGACARLKDEEEEWGWRRGGGGLQRRNIVIRDIKNPRGNCIS